MKIRLFTTFRRHSDEISFLDRVGFRTEHVPDPSTEEGFMDVIHLAVLVELGIVLDYRTYITLKDRVRNDYAQTILARERALLMIRRFQGWFDSKFTVTLDGELVNPWESILGKLLVDTAATVYHCQSEARRIWETTGDQTTDGEEGAINDHFRDTELVMNELEKYFMTSYRGKSNKGLLGAFKNLAASKDDSALHRLGWAGGKVLVAPKLEKNSKKRASGELPRGSVVSVS